MRIEVIGGIASGKSTLVSVISLKGPVAVYENFTENPFFECFYADPERYAFETEITYMLQHFSSIGDALHTGSASIAADFSTALDLAYARVTLGLGDLRVFETVFDRVLEKIGHPDLLIKLDCPPEVELARIRARARPAEKSIGLGYLAELNRAAEGVLDDPRFRGQEVVRIDSASLDFRPEGKDRAEVVAKILARARL